MFINVFVWTPFTDISVSTSMPGNNEHAVNNWLYQSPKKKDAHIKEDNYQECTHFS